MEVKKTLPYMPLYFGDFLAATAKWEGEERSLYMLLLAYEWSSGPLPRDPKRIAKMCQYELKTFSKLWQQVGTKFVDTEAGLINERLEQHRAKSKEISDKRSGAGKKGAESKWQKDGKCQSDANGKTMANAIGNGMANVIGLPCHPNQAKRREEADERGEVSEWKS